MEIIKKIKSNINSLEDFQLFIQVLFLITILPLLVRLLTIPRLMKVLTPMELKDLKNLTLEESKNKIVKYTDYILCRNLWIYKGTCLKRSLVLYHFLHKLGINVHICFGIRYNSELPDKEAKKQLEGHAWLIYNGDIILEKNADETKTFKMTYCFPEEKEKIINQKKV